jgi:hypothetical protein
MEPMTQAALWFWLPAALVPFGAWISLSSKTTSTTTFGRAVALLGIVGIVSSPWTVPDSPSSAAGHLLGFLLGPAALLLAGIYLVAFSGNVPVGRLPKSDRRLGVMSFIIGFVWFIGMHWWNLTPALNGEVNRYWLVFWPTFLLLLTCLLSGSALSLRMIGDRRATESNVMWFASAFVLLLIALAMTIDGRAVDAETFRYHLWLAGADLLGTAVGLSIAILVFGFIIFLHERALPEPESIEPPTEEEFEQVSAIVAANIGGGSEDE